jgi:amino acid adenylation domain-containing protein
MNNHTNRVTNLSPAKRALFELKLGEESARAAAEQTIPRRATRESAPLSFAQQRLWFLNQLEPDNPSYNEPKAVRLSGPLDVSSLHKALAHIVTRHESLRTTFVAVDGNPVQIVGDGQALDLPVEDLRDCPDSTRAVEIDRLLRRMVLWPFDLSRDLMLRTLLLRLADEEHILLLVAHHIASDAWSSDILWRELATLYQCFTAGQASPLRPLPIQYADYAVWQRDRLQGEVLNAQITYWKHQLAAVPPVLNLPVREPRPAVQGYAGALQSLILPQEVTDDVKAFSRREGVTLFTTLLAVFQTLLHRYTAQDDIVVGSPTAGRSRIETEDLIGSFVNTLVLRTDFSGNPSFRELLSRVREIVLGAHAHQDVPFEKLVEELQPERNLDRSPFFQVMFVIQNEPKETRKLADLTVNPFDIHGGTAKFDLLLSMREEQAELKGVLEYNSDLLDGSTISRLLHHFQTLLKGVVADPNSRLSDLPLLTEAERHQLLVEWNDTKRDYPTNKCIHQLVEEQVENSPDAVAVICEDQQLTYRELNARANQLARHLSRLGVGPNVLVGLCLKRSLEMVVALLGVLKAGGAYMPLDPSYPKERLAFMMEDAHLAVVVTHQHVALPLSAHRVHQVFLDASWETVARDSAENLIGKATPDSPAYVLYTSGSTGMPKGVVMRHHALCNLISWQVQSFSPPVKARTLQFAPQSFDVAFQEVFSTWCAGGTLIIVLEQARRDAAALWHLLVAARVERVFLPFVALKQLAEAAEDKDLVLTSLREIVTAGEQLHMSSSILSLLARLKDCHLYNQYGPTETHVVTAFAVTGSPTGRPGLPPIGRPIANTQVYILDKHLQLVPVGVVGELYVGGVALARGYLDRPELTAARFIPDPFSHVPGARLYKTGDLARHLPDGNIQFLGRLDYQVKLRGFRIELGEIESVLGQHPGVRENAVLLREDIPGDRRLTAYVVSRDNPAPLGSELHYFLSEKLPDYMIPSALVVLDRLPLTPSGKVDRSALPVPGKSRLDQEQTFVAPRTMSEEVLADLWSELLGIQNVGVHDNFFDLGGHSLLVPKLIAQIQRHRQVDLPVRSLFESPTIAQLAARIDAADHRAVPGQHPKDNPSNWITLQSGQSQTSVFCFPYAGGFQSDLVRFAKLARLAGPGYSFYGLQARGADGVSRPHRRLKNMVTECINGMKTLQPHGPYFLLGECFSGRLAYATARQLRAQRETVAFLGLLDVRNRHPSLLRYLGRRLTARLRYRFDRIWDFGGWRSFWARTFPRGQQRQDPARWLRGCFDTTANALRLLLYALRGDLAPAVATNGGAPRQRKQLARALKAYWLAVDRYRYQSYADRITVFANEEWYNSDPTLGWTKLAAGAVEVHKIPGNHLSYSTEYIQVVAKELRECLDRAVAKVSGSVEH